MSFFLKKVTDLDDGRYALFLLAMTFVTLFFFPTSVFDFAGAMAGLTGGGGGDTFDF